MEMGPGPGGPGVVSQQPVRAFPLLSYCLVDLRSHETNMTCDSPWSPSPTWSFAVVRRPVARSAAVSAPARRVAAKRLALINQSKPTNIPFSRQKNTPKRIHAFDEEDPCEADMSMMVEMETI